eukprot:1187459-Prorocentrum_minimum.AAC.4
MAVATWVDRTRFVRHALVVLSFNVPARANMMHANEEGKGAGTKTARIETIVPSISRHETQ